jgi:hypothetical protein
MLFHRIEHAVVMVMGFLVGSLLAICIAPGDILLVVVTGVILGFFANEFLDQEFGGDLFWPFARSSGKKRATGADLGHK